MDDKLSAKRQELLAEEAAWWLGRLSADDQKTRTRFAHWLMESPANVREFLIASSWDEALNHLDPQRRIDVDKLLSGAANVVHLPGAQVTAAQKHSRVPATSGKLRFGLAAVVVAAVVLAAMPFVREFFFGATYSTAIGEQRSIAQARGR